MNGDMVSVQTIGGSREDFSKSMGWGNASVSCILEANKVLLMLDPPVKPEDDMQGKRANGEGPQPIDFRKVYRRSRVW